MANRKAEGDGSGTQTSALRTDVVLFYESGLHEARDAETHI